MKSITQHILLGNGDLKVVIKDTIDIAGTRTVAGTRAFEHVDFADEHAEVVNLILDADCQIVGKANLHELAFGVTGINSFTGTPVNPVNPEIIPGGSSSGSAVSVAEGLADFSIGTDTGGSIRMPAACCGLYGLKPTFNRVSRKGVFPEASSLDCVGPLARSMDTLIQAMHIIAPDFKIDDALAILPEPPKFALINVFADPNIWESIYSFLRQKLGYIPQNIELPELIDAYDAGMHVINYENWKAFGSLVATKKLGKDVENRLINASFTSIQDYENAKHIKDIFTHKLSELFESYDVLILPTLPQFPPKVLDAENLMAQLNLTSYLRPFNLSGNPALTLPLPNFNNLPIGLQLVGKMQADEYLCAAAKYLISRDSLQ